MNRRNVLLLALATTPLLGGCSAHYAKSRGLDLMDAVPISAGAGLGLLAEVRATPYVGLGLGYANSWRVGTDEQRLGPLWWEKERGIPVWRYYRHQNYLEETSRWSGGHLRFREERRNRAASLIVAPGMVREGLVWFPIYPPYMITKHWEWPNWSGWDLLNVEAGVFLGVVGIRVGVSPFQLIDFILGLATIDLAEDDVRDEPLRWPDPGAGPPSFDDVEPVPSGASSASVHPVPTAAPAAGPGGSVGS